MLKIFEEHPYIWLLTILLIGISISIFWYPFSIFTLLGFFIIYYLTKNS
jgi:hypothetical protein